MNKGHIRETKSLEIRDFVKEDPPKIEIDLKLRKVPFFLARYREQKRILGPIWFPPIEWAWTASASEKAWLFSSKFSVAFFFFSPPRSMTQEQAPKAGVWKGLESEFFDLFTKKVIFSFLKMGWGTTQL